MVEVVWQDSFLQEGWTPVEQAEEQQAAIAVGVGFVVRETPTMLTICLAFSSTGLTLSTISISKSTIRSLTEVKKEA
tara:strand:+ start:141 stop:371 length:231 start_codon:yes stop_codon:yes gene_type:complete